MNTKKKIALFGGSFDPVHTDHLNIAKSCHNDLGFDEVWFIPTYLNPFKTEQNSSTKDRLAMLEIVANQYDWLKVNDYEIKQERPSFTYQTVQHFLNAPEYKDIDFAFIIGSDQLDNFEKWNDFENLIKAIEFKVFLRSETYNQAVVEKYNLEVFNFDRVNLSSTMIRNLENLDLQIKEVNDYINEHLLYLNDRLKMQMDEDRYVHSLNVGIMAAQLARMNGADEQKALIAGTLHDIAKQWSKEKAKIYLEKWLPNIIAEPTAIWHSATGALHLEHDWKFSDKEIIQAVYNHTVGSPSMSLLDKIIFCADKISAERTYKNVDNYRQACFVNLDEGFKQLIKMRFNWAITKYGENEIGTMLQLTYDHYIKEEKV